MIRRRFFLAGASSLALAGCGGNVLGLGPPDAGTIYPVRPAFPAGNGEKVGWALAILRPDIAPGLDTERMALTQPDGSMDYYAKANYADRVPPLVQQALLDGFEMSGRIDAVAPEQAALHADYNLVTEIKDFGAHYTQTDGIPQVAVGLTAKLATTHGRVIVSSFSTRQTLNASVNSAACKRFSTKPSISRRTSTGIWPTRCMTSRARAFVASDVHGAPQSSTTGARCGGFTGCATMQRARPPSCSVKRDATMADVDEASTQCAGAAASRAANVSRLTSRTSGPLS